MRYDRLRTVKEVEHYAAVEVSSVHIHRLGLLARVWEVSTESRYPNATVTEGGEGGGIVLLLSTGDEPWSNMMHGPYGPWLAPKGYHRTDMDFDSTVLRLPMPWLFKFTENFWWYDARVDRKDCVTVTAYFRTGDLMHRVSTKLSELWMAPYLAVTDYISQKRTKKLTSRL